MIFVKNTKFFLFLILEKTEIEIVFGDILV